MLIPFFRREAEIGLPRPLASTKRFCDLQRIAALQHLRRAPKFV
jgi:hypothetical protein